MPLTTAIQAKHPVLALPVQSSQFPSHAVRITCKHILHYLLSFSKGTAGSRSGWRVAPFLALCQFQSFITEFTSFINLFLASCIPQELSPLVASSVSILKKDSGIRPVVVGKVFRRLVSKICVALIRSSWNTSSLVSWVLVCQVERKPYCTPSIVLFVRRPLIPSLSWGSSISRMR